MTHLWMRQSQINKRDLARRSNKQMFWSDGSVLWKKWENSCINKAVWLKRSFNSERKEGGSTWNRRLHCLCTQSHNDLSPQVPPLAFLDPPSPLALPISAPAVHSEKSNGKCYSVTPEGAIVHNLEMVHSIPQVPDDHVTNMCNPEIFPESRCHFVKLAILDKLHDIFEGQMTCRSKKDRPDSSALQQYPKGTKRVSIIHFSISLRNHIFLPWLTFSGLDPTSLL